MFEMIILKILSFLLAFFVGVYLRSRPILGLIVALGCVSSFLAALKIGDFAASIFVVGIGLIIGAFRDEITTILTLLRERVFASRKNANEPWKGEYATQRESDFRNYHGGVERERAKEEGRSEWVRTSPTGRERKESPKAKQPEKRQEPEKKAPEETKSQSKQREERSQPNTEQKQDHPKEEPQEARQPYKAPPGPKEINAAFEILSIPPTTPPDLVKKAVFILFQLWHPDKHHQRPREEIQLAEANFIRVMNAYKTLQAAGKVE